MSDNREKYDILLAKFCKNDEIVEMLEECMLDELGKREFKYIKTGKYPEYRDLLGKLKTDLILKKIEVINNGR